MIDRILDENTKRYANGSIVDDYMKEQYHVKRIDVALELMVEAIDRLVSHKEKNNIRILELASANGEVAKRIHELGFNVVASDYIIEPLERLNSTGIDLIPFDVSEQFPFTDSSFDVVFAGDIIEHLFDTNHFFRECYRILLDNGLLLLTTPNLATLQDRFRFLLGKSPRQVNPNHEYLKLHIRPFTQQKLKEVATENGFKIYKFKSNYVTLRRGKKQKIYFKSKLLAKLLPGLGGSIIACFRKGAANDRC